MNIVIPKTMLHLAVLTLFLCATSASQAQCDAYAGTLADNPIAQNADGSFQLSAFRLDNVTIPPGFELIYLLSEGDNRVILASDAGSVFRVSSPGYYRVHTMVAELTEVASPDYIAAAEFAPTGITIPELVAQFGSRCASVDELGAQFFVPSDFGTPCNIVAGKLATYGAELTQDRQQVIIAASVQETNIAPGNFESRYLLTRDRESVIVDIGTSASFVVSALDTGLYTIYPFVAELTDPLSQHYFNLSDIVFGQTTLPDLNRDNVDRDLCARTSFLGGQAYIPLQPSLTACVVESGRLFAATMEANTSQDTITLTASRSFPAFLLSGQEVVYFLSSGNDLKIEAFSDFPSFDITSPGEYRIHSAVLEKTDDSSPNFFDLARIRASNLTIPALTTLLVQEGKCASVEEVGASFQIDASQISSVHKAAVSTATFQAWQGNQANTISVRLRPNTSGSAQLMVYNALGQQLSSQKLSVLAQAEYELQLPAIGSSGIYLVRLRDAEGELTRKVMLR